MVGQISVSAEAGIMDDDGMAQKGRHSIIYSHHAPIGIRYTHQHPLVIVANWAMPPYSYINDHGQPDGFFIEIMQEFFSMVHVPYEIHLMNWRKARSEMTSGNAHLLLCVSDQDSIPGMTISTMSLSSYDVGVMHLATQRNVPSLQLFHADDTVHTCLGTYPDRFINDDYTGERQFALGHTPVNDAINRLLDGTINYYIWNKYSLMSMVKKFGLGDRIVVEDIDIPSMRISFLSSDSILVRELENQYQRMVLSGRYAEIHDKWFVNGGTDDTADVPTILVIVVFVLFFVAIFVGFVLFQRTDTSGDLKKEFLTIASVGTELTGCQVLALRLSKQWVYNISSNFIPEKGLSLEDFLSLVHPDDKAQMIALFDDVNSITDEVSVFTIRMLRHESLTDDWRTLHVHGYVKRKKDDIPVYLYLALTDETDRIIERANLDRSLREFSYITTISELALAFYSPDGHFVSGNDALYSIFDKTGTGRARQYFSGTTLQDLTLLFNGLQFEENIDVWFCAPISIAELNVRLNLEVRIRYLRDEQQQLRGYIIAIHDLYSELQRKNDMTAVNRRLSHLRNELSRYRQGMRFVLQKNNINTFRWLKGNGCVDISTDLLDFSHRLALSQYYDDVIIDDKSELHPLLHDTSSYFSQPRHATRCYSTDGGKTKKWYAISTMPDYDAQGEYIGAFGIICDVTLFVTVQERLRRETFRANDSGRQKALFLANMTHELRTPLNAISGFAELLMLMPDEKEEYVRIMHHNCTMLISIIDNILQLSMMDTEGIRLFRHDLDFARAFTDSAQMLSRYVISPDVQYMVENPMHTLPLSVDYERIIQILDAFVNNASKFTKKGHIRVGYAYEADTLSVYCADTGCGISDEHLPHIFDRFYKVDSFVQGSGLGLSVSKSIADAMGATIDVESVVGEGSTFTLSIPLE